MKLLSNSDYARFIALQEMSSRAHEVSRWLSEINELDPMWDYIFGKRVTTFYEKGHAITTMAEGSISSMREKLRERFKGKL